MKSKSDKITFIIEGQVYESWPEVEQRRKRLMFANHAPDSIVKCYEFGTDELLDELPLNVLFNEI